MRNRLRLRTLVRAAIVPAALLVAFGAWALASPVGASPDEDYHLASIWCGSGLQHGLCEAGDAPDERRVPRFLNSAPCFAFQSEQSAGCQVGQSGRLVNTDRGNFDGAYPPVFYATMSVFAGTDVARSVVTMRMVNAAIFVAVTSALYFLLAPGRRGPLLWGLLVTVVPLGMFLIPSLNPSSWAVTSAATLWVSLQGYWRTESRGRRIWFGVLAALMAIAAAGARPDAALYSVLAIAVAIVLTAELSRRSLLLGLAPLGLALVAAVLFFASGSSSVVTAESDGGADAAHSGFALVAANLVLLPSLWTGALGTWGLGWLDTALPGSVWFPAVAAFVALIFWGLTKMGRRKAISLVLVAASLVAIPLYVLVNEGIVVGADVQPRYIYPLMIMLAGLAALGFDKDDLGLSRIQLALIGSGVVIANAVALHTNIRRYVTGTDVSGPNLDSGREWWWHTPVPPMAVWAIGAAAFAIAVVGTCLAVSAQGRPSSDASSVSPST